LNDKGYGDEKDVFRRLEDGLTLKGENQNQGGQEQIRLSDTRGKMFLYDEGGEYVQSDGSSMTIAGGSGINLTAGAGDVVIPVNIGLVLGDGGEKIDRADTMSTARCRLNRVGNEPFGPVAQ